MTDLSGRQIRQQAYAYLRDLERPASISPRQWVGVKAFLYIVARGQPRMYKSQETIAQEMGISVRTVKYYVEWACIAGLLTVWSNAGIGRPGNPRRTHQYHLTELLVVGAESAPTVGADSAHNYSGLLRNPGIKKEENPGEPTVLLEPLRGFATRRVCRVDAVAEGKSASEIAAAVNARGRISRRPPARDPDPARRLTTYFFDQWEEQVAGKRDDLGHIRPGIVGKARKYLRDVFFSPAQGRVRSEDEVRVLIDQFMAAAYRGQARIAKGQTAFDCFTGWWGRQRPAAYDDREIYERYEKKLRGIT